jgi:iron-sulfur cluster repair protein YtfE (RIC family)
MPKESNAISLLRKDHIEVKLLFKQAEHAGGKNKVIIFNMIKASLAVHAQIEEEIFYPAVKKARSEQVKDEVREGYEEHKQIKRLLAALSKITPADETYDMKLKVLKEDVEHHVKEEESEMFPDAKKYLREDRLAELGEELDHRKKQLQAHHNGVAHKDSRDSEPARSAK